MSQWITDRKPTEHDGVGYDELVWIWVKSMYHNDRERPYLAPFFEVKLGTPWTPILPPSPYGQPDAQADYTDYLRAEVDRLTKLCSKYERTINALQEAGVIS